MGGVVSRTQCPACAADGKDRSGDNMALYGDGGGKCFACGYVQHKGEKPMEVLSSPKKASMSLEEVLKLPLATGASTKRSVSDDVLKLFDERVEYDVVTGEPKAFYYIYHDDYGPVNYKRRAADTKRFTTGGSLPGVYGKQLWTGTDFLIITEGEEDCHAAKEMLSAGHGLKASLQDVCSLPNGANNKTRDGKVPAIEPEVLAEFDSITSYKRVFICLDNDDAGKFWSEQLADWLCQGTEVRLVDLPKKYGKDSSDYLKANKIREWRKAIANSEAYSPDGIVDGRDIDIHVLAEPIPQGYEIPFPGLQDKLMGLRKAEIMTICAGSGVGKSTVLRELMYSLTKQGAAIANIALEDQMNVAAQAMVALDMNIPLWKFRFHPPTVEEQQASYDKYVANGRTYFYKHFGGLTADSLITRLNYYIKAKKVDFICLDHLSLVVSATQTNNERKDIDTLMTKLAQLVTSTGVGLLQIVHLKRANGDKSFAKGGEVELTDLRGSAALEQLSWTVLACERDQQGDSPELVKLRLLKNRTVGCLGVVDTLKYMEETGRLLPYTPIETDDTEIMSPEELTDAMDI